jgi:CPA1 family monovalent cation:H+ antiporter
VVFVLNVLAFILIGLQLKPILERLSRSGLIAYVEMGVAVTAAVILVRIVWVLGYGWIGGWLRERMGTRRTRPVRYASLGSATAIAWCGMRGIVTLAAALAPSGWRSRAGRLPLPRPHPVLCVRGGPRYAGRAGHDPEPAHSGAPAGRRR